VRTTAATSGFSSAGESLFTHVTAALSMLDVRAKQTIFTDSGEVAEKYAFVVVGIRTNIAILD